jgi:hypothetical protein
MAECDAQHLGERMPPAGAPRPANENAELFAVKEGSISAATTTTRAALRREGSRSGTATRVSSRAAHHPSTPEPSAPLSRGNPSSASATRSFSETEQAWLEAARGKRAVLDAEEGRWLLHALRAAAHVHLAFGSFYQYVERLFGYSRDRHGRLASWRHIARQRSVARPSLR